MTTRLIVSAYSGLQFTQIAASAKKYYMRFPFRLTQTCLHEAGRTARTGLSVNAFHSESGWCAYMLCVNVHSYVGTTDGANVARSRQA